jgi:hypothetical protein
MYLMYCMCVYCRAAASAGDAREAIASAPGPDAAAAVAAAVPRVRAPSAAAAVRLARQQAHAARRERRGAQLRRAPRGGGARAARLGLRLSAAPRRGQMRLLVAVRLGLQLGPCEAAGANTGLGGLANNKGDVLVSVEVERTVLCFVVCHLAAHEGDRYRRARDESLRAVLCGARVGPRSLPPAGRALDAGAGAPRLGPRRPQLPPRARRAARRRCRRGARPPAGAPLIACS